MAAGEIRAKCLKSLVPRGGIETTAYVAVSEYIFDSKRAADTNVNTNRIFLWISAVPNTHVVRARLENSERWLLKQLAAFGAAFDPEPGPAQTRHRGISIDAAQNEQRLQCRSQDRSVEALALLQPEFEQFTEGTVTADLRLPSVYWQH